MRPEQEKEHLTQPEGCGKCRLNAAVPKELGGQLTLSWTSRDASVNQSGEHR